MSMITEQVEYLIKLSNKQPFDSNIPTLQRACKEAANTISVLSKKLQAANMERSTAYYNGGWIPVSERLPEDIRPVIVTWKNNDPKSYYQYIVGKHFIGTAHYKNGTWFWYSSTTEDMLAEYGRCDSEEFDEAIEVIAWIPLPKPYIESIQSADLNSIETIREWIDNAPTVPAIPIPENATNGEILCSIFPDMHYILSEKTPRVVTTIGVASSFDIDWWNSPYKRGETE